MADAAVIPTDARDDGRGHPVEQDQVAPRISIEVFCVTDAFAEVLQVASKDRRMAKATTAVGMGGVEAAVKRYRNLGAPHLVIVESLEGGFTLFGELAKLAEVVDPETQVIVAGPSNDVALYRELLRNGVSDYLVTPCAPIQVIEAIIGSYETPDAAPIATSLALYGVRGGVGSSSIAYNLASELVERSGKETMLIDLDIEFGASALGFNIDSKYSIVDAYSDVDGLDDVKLARLLVTHKNKLKLLPAPADLLSRGPALESEALALIDVARRSCDYLVLDAPSGWRACSRVALRQATIPVLVATPDLISLRNMRLVLEWLKSERPNDAPPKIILNQVGEAKRPEIDEKEFADIIGAPIDLSLAWDPATFGAALNDGKMLRDASAGSGGAAQIAAFADRLLGREGARTPQTGTFARLLNKIGWSS